MNLPHVHLLLNHWPIIGTYIALGLLFVSLLSRSDDLKQVSLVLFSLLGLVAIPVYLSGNAAADTIKRLPNFPQALVESHEGAALVAFMAMELTGLAALIGVWGYSRNGSSASRSTGGWNAPLVLFLALVTAGLMAIAGTTGGDIRHPEIISGDSASSIGTMGAAWVLGLRYFIIDYSRWVWPLVETAHFLGLILLLGTVGVLNLRILGLLKNVPVGPFHRFLPWGIAGLSLNVATGFLFFIGMPFFYVFNAYFQAKILVIVIAGANLLFHCTGAFRKWEGLGSGEDAPALAKLIAASSLVLWVVVVVIGRYIPLGESAQ